ncbi:DNA cytosine methyltransferase [Sphingomonas sp. HITSZ_GF]|uniref:DNA cytosine methyltransferase n=1 Tax=Sphingomonas sp. HITSZ_GF TaxID=3037247 RepID=UPI00240D0907|nr:DNA cytosine methyltransferase [Sphingomonas sp. HITSZ_GF]MDG2535252.1 DNA cytosine methyltransferase [Sphingomonas sp. HITSZ_GF]
MSARSKSAAERREPSFLAVDFFCGAGGTTRGLIDAGGYVLAGVDKDTRCRETYVENNSNEKLDFTAPRFLHRDIFPRSEDYSAGEQSELMAELDALIMQYKQEVPTAPLLFAICAPCQPFTKLSRKELSAARKAGREKDSNLLSEATKFVEHFKPEMVLSENVQGIKDPRYGGVWQEFREALESLGYVTGTKVVCTSDFGVPQYRKRSILIAVRKALVRPEFLSTDGRDELHVPVADPDNVVKTVRSAIGHLPPLGAGSIHPTIPNHKTRTLSELNLKRLAAARPGVSNIYLEDTPHGDLSLACHRKVNKKLHVRCFTDVYTRMSPDRPSPTITTKCHSISNGRFGHFDVDQLRGISLREAAMLQSFPPDYIFYPIDKIEPVARMIGNAVPPRLAEYFSRYLHSAIGAADA